MTIEEFHTEFMQDLAARSGSKEDFTRSVFVEHMCGFLADQGLFADFSQTDYKDTTKGYAVDAWAFEEDLSTLVLLVSDFRDSPSLENLTNTQIMTGFNRLSRFIDASRNEDFVAALDESMPVAELAWFIAKPTSKLERLTLVLASNARLSARVESLPRNKIAGLHTTYEVWDLGRLHRLESSGQEKEAVEVDLTSFDASGLRCLPAFIDGGSMQSYLLVLPGSVLADLYQQYGERLLEQNVRTFLQFRGKVNKGIRNTIVNEPQMFFSYNNGISATADEVVTSKNSDRILRIRNLQIVNGGQTTASIFAAGKKESANLSAVHVQVKLSIVPKEKVEVVVPRISEYANTQNKVSAADFFSNHPFHLRIEEFSRRLWAPSPIGAVLETHWFYERARGQYVNKQAQLSATDRRKFLLQNPRGQMFTKTDLAKFILTFDELPHVVSLGAQKTFAGSPRSPGFVGFVAKEWESSSGRTFNELWFKRAVSKAIFVRQLDLMILQQSWYSGYKANIVTYSLAKFASMVREAGRFVDHVRIWRQQAVPPAAMDELVTIARAVNDILLNPPPDMTSNVSEWAKNPHCWDLVLAAKMDLGPALRQLLIDSYENEDREKEGGRTQDIQDGIQAQTYVVEKGATYWTALRDWNRTNRKLSPKETSVLDTACAMPRRIPSDKQAAVLIAAERRCLEDGFFAG